MSDSIEARRRKLQELRESRAKQQAAASGSAPAASTSTAAPSAASAEASQQQQSAAPGTSGQQQQQQQEAADASEQQQHQQRKVELTLDKTVLTSVDPCDPPELYDKGVQTDPVCFSKSAAGGSKGASTDGQQQNENDDNDDAMLDDDALGNTADGRGSGGGGGAAGEAGGDDDSVPAYMFDSFSNATFWSKVAEEASAVSQSDDFHNFVSRAATAIEVELQNAAAAAARAGRRDESLLASSPAPKHPGGGSVASAAASPGGATTAEGSPAGAGGAGGAVSAFQLSKRGVLFHPTVADKLVSDVAYHPQNNDLLAACYCAGVQHGGGASGNFRSTDSSAYGGSVIHVWSTRQKSNAQPAYVFHADADVSCVCFSPFHPELLIGGSINGQLLVWDMREGSRPVQSSFPSLDGHCDRICSMYVTGTSNSNSIISAGHSARVCTWDTTRPMFSNQTTDLARSKDTEDSLLAVRVRSMGIPQVNASRLYIGAESGALLQGNRSTSARQVEVSSMFALARKTGDAVADAAVSSGHRHHAQAITSVHCHPQNTIDTRATNLVLTSSMDWTCRVWSGANYLVLDQFADFVTDAKWSPRHPSILAAGDASGKVSLWNLAESVEQPVAEIMVSGSGSGGAGGMESGTGGGGGGGGAAGDASSASSGGTGGSSQASWGSGAIQKLTWDNQGEHLAVGTSRGEIVIISTHSTHISVASNEQKFGAFISHHFGS